MEVKSKEHARLAGEVELKEHSLALLQDRIAASEAHQVLQAVAQAEAEAAAAKAQFAAAGAKGAAAKAESLRLEREMGDFAQERDKRLKAAERAMKEARATLAAGRQGAKAFEDRARSLAAER